MSEIYSKEYLTAYAEFLLSERNRHLDDIKNIDEKLQHLAAKNIIALKEGPWILITDIDAFSEDSNAPN